MNNSNVFKLIFIWYVLPFIFLLCSGIFLPKILIILSFFFLGFSLSYFSSSNKHILIPIRVKYFDFIKISKLIVVLSFSLSLYGLIYYFFIVRGRYIDVREVYYNGGSVFQSTYIFTFYEIFLTPIIIIVLPILMINKFKNKRIYIFLTLLFVLIDAFLKQGRFQILFLFFVIIYYNNYFHIKLKNIIGLGFVLLLFSLYIFLNRQIPDFSLVKIFNSYNIIDYSYLSKYTINYQVYGYILLDKFASLNSPLGNFLEFNSLSFVFYILNTFFFIKLFGFKLDYPWEIYNSKISLGIFDENFLLQINAFSTNFYPLYLDGGLLYVFIYGLTSGFIVGVNSDIKFLKILKFLNFYILIFGLYQPVITFFIGLIYQILVFILLFYLLKNSALVIAKDFNN